MRYLTRFLCLGAVCWTGTANSETAAERWDEANRILASGDTLKAAIALTELIDDYSNSPECVIAYNAFVSMAEDHEDGAIPQSIIAAYSAAYPSIESVDSPEAKWIIIEHYSYEMMLAFERGDEVAAGQFGYAVRSQCRTVFETFPDSQVAIGTVQRYTEVSRALGEATAAEATTVLRALINDATPTVARWAACFTLAWHIGFTNGDREEAKTLRQSLIDSAAHSKIQTLLSHPNPLYFVRVDCEYALGDALIRVKRYAEAAQHFDRAAAYPYQGKGTEMADFAAAKARHRENPRDAQGAIDRYEAHLAAYPQSDRKAEAHFAIGTLQEQRGRMTEARQHYDQAISAAPDTTIAANATTRRDLLINR